ncbi:amino acid transporter avt6c [Quercus suber]|uniref:Amino acid transporter avt6c n=1 Tax=Quercus suber TaxID=58331 RepID=A0AAW0LKA8_QUESU
MNSFSLRSLSWPQTQKIFVPHPSSISHLYYLAAIAIPNIWYFFQFLGSTSAVCLAFIFPGAIVIRDVHGISTSRDRIVAAVMIILAVVTSTIAISTNIFICLAFIFPGAIVIRDVHGISTSRDRIVAAVMIILAVVTSTIAISTNIFSFF